jgi:hypothetical protein
MLGFRQSTPQSAPDVTGRPSGAKSAIRIKRHIMILFVATETKSAILFPWQQKQMAVRSEGWQLRVWSGS